MRLKTYRRPARRRADRAVTVLLVVALVAATAWLLVPEGAIPALAVTTVTLIAVGGLFYTIHRRNQ